jgi:hypothetical protein
MAMRRLAAPTESAGSWLSTVLRHGARSLDAAGVEVVEIKSCVERTALSVCE